ncbi:sigma-70 family RNA polymerase sigma factor [Modestobacter sp. VKM Ac-2986]|uniref:sigma-70 family RNA polymerase sigma factor n=1 Tax=Modestobacter sp. VKM Ac-2986 TaxID=3004140 RepID=UPI0022AA4B56|nr:sigma-70 family RNA polymerase sigma factor [Modestobacter sp. VKM Ac-2986]MCZ2827909.1 sigma-70 family RNA polymerase sigma factor [Modestobacter sp. VKM Ac-2986]
MSRPRPAAPSVAPPPSPAAARPVRWPRASARPRPAPQPRTPLDAVPPGQADVWELVRRTQDGDAEAFGQLYDRYVDVVHRFLSARVGDRATAEDFTSETFVRALRRIDSLSFQGRDVGAWLVTIARNIVLDHVKSSRFRLEVPTADMRDADRATEGPEDAVLQRLTNAALFAGIAQLSEDQRVCLALRFLQGLSVAETAAAMGRKEGAVKALQHRAVRRLAALLPEGLA